LAAVEFDIQGRAKVPVLLNISENINFLEKWFRQKNGLKNLITDDIYLTLG